MKPPVAGVPDASEGPELEPKSSEPSGDAVATAEVPVVTSMSPTAPIAASKPKHGFRKVFPFLLRRNDTTLRKLKWLSIRKAPTGGRGDGHEATNRIHVIRPAVLLTSNTAAAPMMMYVVDRLKARRDIRFDRYDPRRFPHTSSGDNATAVSISVVVMPT